MGPIFLALMTTALAEPDVDALMALSDALLDGPTGCWEVVGRSTWSHDFGRWGATRGDAAFVGRTEDGVWGELYLRPLGEVQRQRRSNTEDRAALYAAEPRFTPLSGRVRGLAVRLDRQRQLRITRSSDRRVQPVNTARDVIDALTGDVETFELVPETDGWTLRRAREAGRDAVLIESHYATGDSLPTLWTLTIPAPYRHGPLGVVRVQDLDARIRGRIEGDRVFPQAESLRFELRLAGITVRAAQTLDYTSWSPCLGPE